MTPRRARSTTAASRCSRPGTTRAPSAPSRTASRSRRGASFCSRTRRPGGSAGIAVAPCPLPALPDVAPARCRRRDAHRALALRATDGGRAARARHRRASAAAATSAPSPVDGTTPGARCCWARASSGSAWARASSWRPSRRARRQSAPHRRLRERAVERRVAAHDRRRGAHGRRRARGGGRRALRVGAPRAPRLATLTLVPGGLALGGRF